MACRGVFFAITIEQAEALLAAKGDDQMMGLIEEIEEAWDGDQLAECDKAWDAMHRTLTDGELGYGNGPYPLNHCVLSPHQLYNGAQLHRIFRRPRTSARSSAGPSGCDTGLVSASVPHPRATKLLPQLWGGGPAVHLGLVSGCARALFQGVS
jgi:Domain of unknown function (DUF1877)